MVANPLGTILSVVMMLRYAFDMKEEADAIELAVNKTLDDGYHTGDIMQEGMIKVGCSKIGDIVRERI